MSVPGVEVKIARRMAELYSCRVRETQNDLLRWQLDSTRAQVEEAQNCFTKEKAPAKRLECLEKALKVK